MSWHVELIHGNDREDETTVETFEAAVLWVEAQELEIHGEPGGLDSMREVFDSGDPDAGGVQYGTNYHYVVFREKP
jgi:hypothetical protein